MANFLLLLARRIAAILKAYFARVSADGGTSVDDAHAEEVYTDTVTYNPTLIQSCESGKAGTLYSIIPSQELLLYQYTGAAAAYSLRSLSAGTIYVVKVRRSGDDAELDFTAEEVSDGTLAAWVVAGGGTEDGFVTTWYDQSGNANNATQATAANQPKIVSSGTLVTENGKAALDFDGGDFLSLISNIGITGTVSRSIFHVGLSQAIDVGSNGRAFISIGDGSSNNNSDKWELNHEFSVRVYGGNEVYAGGVINTQYLTSNIFSGTNVTDNTYYVNGLSQTVTGSFASTINTDDTVAFIGKSPIGNPYDGTMQEMIVYASDQSANRTGIEANINAHYNIYT